MASEAVDATVVLLFLKALLAPEAVEADGVLLDCCCFLVLIDIN